MRGRHGLSQIEVSRALEMTDRTIRNWETNPAFLMYLDQLEHDKEKRRRRRRRTELNQFSQPDEATNGLV